MIRLSSSRLHCPQPRPAGIPGSVLPAAALLLSPAFAPGGELGPLRRDVRIHPRRQCVEVVKQMPLVFVREI